MSSDMALGSTPPLASMTGASAPQSLSFGRPPASMQNLSRGGFLSADSTSAHRNGGQQIQSSKQGSPSFSATPSGAGESTRESSILQDIKNLLPLLRDLISLLSSSEAESGQPVASKDSSCACPSPKAPTAENTDAASAPSGEQSTSPASSAATPSEAPVQQASAPQAATAPSAATPNASDLSSALQSLDSLMELFKNDSSDEASNDEGDAKMQVMLQLLSLLMMLLQMMMQMLSSNNETSAAAASGAGLMPAGSASGSGMGPAPTAPALSNSAPVPAVATPAPVAATPAAVMSAPTTAATPVPAPATPTSTVPAPATPTTPIEFADQSIANFKSITSQGKSASFFLVGGALSGNSGNTLGAPGAASALPQASQATSQPAVEPTTGLV